MNLDQHRARQNRAITAGITTICAVGFASAVIPGVEHIITTALLALALVVVVVGALRWVARRLRERREDAADLLTGAAWRAEHMPQLVAQLDGHAIGHSGRGPAGVA